MKPPISTDVTCRSVMSAGFASLTADMTITECVETLLKNRVLAMPVVDDGGRYIGHFRKNLLISAILPRVAVVDERIERIARMLDTGLLRDTWGEVLSSYKAIAEDPVTLHLDKEAPVLRPDDSLVAAMYYLFRGRNFLPVVEPGSGMLVGVVSAWDVLENLIAKP